MRLGWIYSAALVLIATAPLGGCGGDDDGGGSSSGGSGGGGTGGGSSECKPTDATCYFAGPEGPGSACMAKADFSAEPITQLRMSSHQVVSPESLASPIVQVTIITHKSALAEPNCSLPNGKGQFNFLMQIDTGKKELTLGGGAPQKLIGPATDGTCWAQFTDATSGLEVKQYSSPYTESGGELTAMFDKFVMPIYTEDKYDAESAVLVPLHQMTFKAKLSADKNCVGRFAPENLVKANSCEAPDDKFAWVADGSYNGYITVEEADQVTVVSLAESLCVLLTGDPSKWKGTNADCKSSKGFTDTGGMPKGDWCSTTNSPGGCQDSWKLDIKFAAQAIKIKGVFDSAKGGC